MQKNCEVLPISVSRLTVYTVTLDTMTSSGPNSRSDGDSELFHLLIWQAGDGWNRIAEVQTPKIPFFCAVTYKGAIFGDEGRTWWIISTIGCQAMPRNRSCEQIHIQIKSCSSLCELLLQALLTRQVRGA